MPISQIENITRTNTIDEWRIQTNKSASDLNDLGFSSYDKTQGTLIISNTASLRITASGTPFEVVNSVLFQNNLSLANNFYLGTVGTPTGNAIIGGTVSIGGSGATSLNVANGVTVGTDLAVTRNISASNAAFSNHITVANNITASGILRLPGTVAEKGNVIYANSGSAYINTVFASTINSANVASDNVRALQATFDVLNLIGLGTMLNLQVFNDAFLVDIIATGNSYFDVANVRSLTVNSSANIVTLSSNTSTINNAILGNATVTRANVTNMTVDQTGNVVTLISNLSLINTANILITNANVGNIRNFSLGTGSITTAAIENQTFNVAVGNTSTIQSANIVTLQSNQATINTGNVTRIFASNANVSTVNVSSLVDVTTGGLVRVAAGASPETTVLQVAGKTNLANVVIDGNLTVSGAFTQTGTVNFQIQSFLLNANTATNLDASIINKRVQGDNAIINWDESVDQWKISTGNTYSQLNRILDAGQLSSQVTNTSITDVATPAAVNTVHTISITASHYANAAFLQANTPSHVSNSASSYANSAFLQANTPSHVSNSAALYANAAFIVANTPTHVANSAALYANAAFIVANTPSHVANSAGFYANGAFVKANTADINANAASSYANAAFTQANSAFVSATNAQLAADAAQGTGSASYVLANTTTNTALAGFAVANSAALYANSAFLRANNSLLSSGGTMTGDLTMSGSNSINASRANIAFDLLGVRTGASGARIVMNYDIIQSADPLFRASLVVDRGVSPNVEIRWNEPTAKWQFTNDGSTYTDFGGSTAPAVAGGTNRQILVQTGVGATGFIDAPSTANRYLQWTGSAFTWAEVPSADLTELSASNLTSGTIPAARMPATGSFGFNITGSAGSALTAATATTATTAVNATNAVNISGGNVQNALAFTVLGTPSIGDGTSTFYNRLYIRDGGTTTSKTDPSDTAALKVLGDIAVSTDVWATLFNGTATSARYADLAEKYLPDADYPEGTVMAIGGEKEVTAASDVDFRAIGVISLKPAFRMNENLENGVYVALKGRVPVRVKGEIKKGQPIGTSDTLGVGKLNARNHFAIALETKTTEEEGVIEALIL